MIAQVTLNAAAGVVAETGIDPLRAIEAVADDRQTVAEAYTWWIRFLIAECGAQGRREYALWLLVTPDEVVAEAMRRAGGIATFEEARPC